ncbi:MAG: hypothetical protein ACE5E5_08270 [Phycisphaerae bacterium]
MFIEKVIGKQFGRHWPDNVSATVLPGQPVAGATEIEHVPPAQTQFWQTPVPPIPPGQAVQS